MLLVRVATLLALLAGATLAPACAKVSNKGASSDGASGARVLALGKSKLLEKDVRYSVAGSDLVVVNRGATMTSALVDNDPNKETHVLNVKLEVMNGSKTELITVTSQEPVVHAGYRFTADPLGFQWGRADAAIAVERAP